MNFSLKSIKFVLFNRMNLCYNSNLNRIKYSIKIVLLPTVLRCTPVRMIAIFNKDIVINFFLLFLKLIIISLTVKWNEYRYWDWLEMGAVANRATGSRHVIIFKSRDCSKAMLMLMLSMRIINSYRSNQVIATHGDGHFG